MCQDDNTTDKQSLIASDIDLEGGSEADEEVPRVKTLSLWISVPLNAAVYWMCTNVTDRIVNSIHKRDYSNGFDWVAFWLTVAIFFSLWGSYFVAFVAYIRHRNRDYLKWQKKKEYQARLEAPDQSEEEESEPFLSEKYEE
jgi:hypothetical protein